MRPWFRMWILASALANTANAQAIVEFDTDGGDAWTYRLPVSGRFDPQRCTSVSIASATVRIEALRIDDRFHATIPLLPGRTELRAICSRDEHEIATTPTQVWHSGLEDVPKAWIRLRTERDTIHLDAGRTQPAPSLPAPIVRYEWYADAKNPAPLRSVEGKALSSQDGVGGEHVQIAKPTADGDYHLSVRAVDAIGRADESKSTFRVRKGELDVIDPRYEHPAWVDAAVLYGAAPYMFEPQGLQGIEQRLDEIAALGATAVWVSPVTAAAPDDFGYAVVDQFSIREDFGGATALRSLVDRAHALGLRVLVDFVPNHFSQFHAYFKDAEEKGPRSPYYDWFDREADGEITQYFDWQHLKNLNFDHPGVRQHTIAAAARFIREFDIDGFRIDASWGVARRAPEFWPVLREELKRIDPDILLIAEASAREPYHVAHGFDAAYDWTENLGEWAWKDVFGDDGKVDVQRLREAITNRDRGYPSDSLIVRFLNNNDTGERFIARHGEDTARVAATLLFTLPGIPLIYNGDEVGAQFQPYDEGPPIQWRESSLTDHYRRLAALRREVPAFRSRELHMLQTTRDDAVLAYLRPGAQRNSNVIVLINFSGGDVLVAGADVQTREYLQRSHRDALSGKDVVARNGAVEIPAHSALVLRARD